MLEMVTMRLDLCTSSKYINFLLLLAPTTTYPSNHPHNAQFSSLLSQFTSAGDEVPAFWPYIDPCLKALLLGLDQPITDIAEEAIR